MSFHELLPDGISNFTILSNSDGIPVSTKTKCFVSDGKLYFFTSAMSTLAEHLSFNPYATILINDNTEIFSLAKQIKPTDELHINLLDESIEDLAKSPIASWFVLSPLRVIQTHQYGEVQTKELITDLSYARSIKLKLKYRINYWIRITRAPFMTAIVGTMLIAGAYAYWQSGFFNWLYYLLAILGMLFMHGSSNVLNDAFDTATDEINTNTSPFNGGSRLVQHLTVTKATTLLTGLFLLIMGAVIGLYLDYSVSGSIFTTDLSNHVILGLGVIGAVIIVFYTMPPFKLSYRGMGDLSIVIGFGILPVLGVVYLITKQITFEAFIVSVIAGLFVELILWVNSFPDAVADELANKRTMVVRLGIEKSRYVYHLIVSSIFILLIISVAVRILPIFALLSLLSLIILVKAMILVHKFAHTNPMSFFPAMPMTVISQLIFSILLASSILLAGVIRYKF